MDDISIDRLVLEIPGITIAEAEDLASRIGEGLAAGAAVSGSFDVLSFDAAGHVTAAGVPRLANAVVASLLRQME